MLSKNKLSNYIPLSYCLFLIALLFVAFYLGIAFYPLADNNEGMYAEIAREMLETKQFIIPHLNYLPYLEKPPLFYWLMSMSMWLFGPTTFAARLIPSSAAVFTCLAILFLAYKCQRLSVGWMAAVILASSFGFVIIGHIVFFDMLLTLWFTFSLVFFYLWFNSKTKAYLYASYAFLALAILTKGIVALALALPIALGYLLWIRTDYKREPLVDYKTLLSFFNPIAIGIFLAIVIPWHVLAQLQWHDFARDYFINEQWMRFLDKRVPHDYYTGPIYYYLPRLVIYLLPWSLLLLGVLFFRRKQTPEQQAIVKSVAPLKPLLWLWFLVPLVFFSLSRAKANYYMVVGLPPLVLLMSLWIQQRLNNSFLYVALIASWIFPAMLLALWGLNKYQDYYSKRHLVHYFLQHYPNTPLFLYQDYERSSSIAFYLKRRLIMVDSKSKDLYYGQQNMPSAAWFITMPQFLQRTTPSYIVVLGYRREAFTAATQIKPLCEVMTMGNATLFTNNCTVKK